MSAHLPLQALRMALTLRKPGPGLIHHSDQGSQYACNDYVQYLEKHGIIMSMSRAGRPWENPYCESFMQTLKNEEINDTTYTTLEDLERHIVHFIEQYYNLLRLHSALQYRTPDEFECAAAAATPPQPYLRATLSFPRYKEIYPDA